MFFSEHGIYSISIPGRILLVFDPPVTSENTRYINQREETARMQNCRMAGMPRSIVFSSMRELSLYTDLRFRSSLFLLLMCECLS